MAMLNNQGSLFSFMDGTNLANPKHYLGEEFWSPGARQMFKLF